jgi:hypothetical protein
METGFYHPERGYWQTTGDVPQYILDGYPISTVEVPIKPGLDHEWDGDAWVYVAPDPAIALAQSRAAMVISPLQGILTLGETKWGKVLAYRDTASWAEKVVIDNAADWVRTSQNIAFFGYLLGYTDEQMDALFIAAAQVTA